MNSGTWICTCGFSNTSTIKACSKCQIFWNCSKCKKVNKGCDVLCKDCKGKQTILMIYKRIERVITSTSITKPEGKIVKIKVAIPLSEMKEKLKRKPKEKRETTAKPVDGQQKTWTCVRCTLINSIKDKNCSVCNAAKPALRK